MKINDIRKEPFLKNEQVLTICRVCRDLTLAFQKKSKIEDEWGARYLRAQMKFCFQHYLNCVATINECCIDDIVSSVKKSTLKDFEQDILIAQIKGCYE